MRAVLFLCICFHLPLSLNQQSEVILPGEEQENDKKINEPIKSQNTELPDLEIVQPKPEVARNSIWRTILVFLPVLLFTFNQLWNYCTTQITAEFSKMFKLRYSQYFIPKSPTNDTITIASDENPVITDNGDIEADTIIPETESSTSNQQLCEARDLVFKEREGGHHISLLPGKNRVLTYIFEIESLLRQDVLTSFWNKVHNNTDKIEITAFVKTKERFSLFLGRRSFFCSDTLKDVKLVCSESNDLSYLNLPKYILYLTECSGLGNILGINFFDSIRNNIQDFNYLYISDLPRTDVEHEALRTYGCNGIFIRISLILSNQLIWGYILNNLESLIKEYCIIVKNISFISLPKETQAKIEKSRLKLQEQKLKEDHQKRQELAMKKKDEKIRALKERIMSEADVDKQIKMKEKFDRMEAKNKMKKCNKGKSVMVIS